MTSSRPTEIDLRLRQGIRDVDGLVVALRTGDVGSVARLEQALQRVNDVLRELAQDPRTPEARRRALLLTRDTISSHLRAAEEVRAARGKPSSRTRLVVRAARELHLALDRDASAAGRLGA